MNAVYLNLSQNLPFNHEHGGIFKVELTRGFIFRIHCPDEFSFKVTQYFLILEEKS